jgi:hypothetical protein
MKVRRWLFHRSDAVRTLLVQTPEVTTSPRSTVDVSGDSEDVRYARAEEGNSQRRPGDSPALPNGHWHRCLHAGDSRERAGNGQFHQLRAKEVAVYSESSCNDEKETGYCSFEERAAGAARSSVRRGHSIFDTK